MIISKLQKNRYICDNRFRTPDEDSFALKAFCYWLGIHMVGTFLTQIS